MECTKGRLTRWFGIGVLFCLTASCQPELDAVEWEPVDYEGLLEAFENPTGELVDNSVEETLEAISEATGIETGTSEGYIDLLNLIWNQVDTVLEDIVESDGDDPEPPPVNKNGQVSGVNAYALKSCAGPNPDNPNTDFEFGQIRFESSSFKFKDAVEMGLSSQIVGDVLVRWEDCQRGKFTAAGDAPGFISDSSDEMLFDFALTISSEEDGSRIIESAVLISLSSISVLVETALGSTYVLGIAPGSVTEFFLGTADGFYVCAVGATQASCTKEE